MSSVLRRVCVARAPAPRGGWRMHLPPLTRLGAATLQDDEPATPAAGGGDSDSDIDLDDI